MIEKKESTYSEASFKNSLKNDAAKKKDKNKDSKKSDKEDDEEDDELNLSDEEKDARDYQLQRAIDMVIAMAHVQDGISFIPATPDDEPATASDDKDSDTIKDDKNSDEKSENKSDKKK